MMNPDTTIAVFECANGSRQFVCNISLGELLKNVELEGENGLDVLKADLAEKGLARIDGFVGTWFEYEVKA